MAYRLFGAKPSFEPILAYWQIYFSKKNVSVNQNQNTSSLFEENAFGNVVC